MQRTCNVLAISVIGSNQPFQDTVRFRDLSEEILLPLPVCGRTISALLGSLCLHRIRPAYLNAQLTMRDDDVRV